MPVLIPSNRAGPTGTKTLATNYRRHLQRPLNALRRDVRRGIVDEDVFGLRVSTDTLADGDIPPLVRMDRTQRQVDAFERWLQDRLQAGVLEQIQRGSNTFVRSAYARGLKDANRMLAAVGGDVPDMDIEAAFNMGVHRRSLQRLFQENYEDLEDITREMSRQIREELTEGLAAGENPRKVARRITDRVDKIGKTRAEVLSRTRLIDAHQEASLNRWEELGVDTVSVVEFHTAEDQRVCPLCKRLHGKEFPIGDARGGTFTVDDDDLGEDEPPSHAGTYPIRPPIHPQCRCTLLPIVT